MNYKETVMSLILARYAQKLTQRDLAKRMETSQGYVSDLEKLACVATLPTLNRWAGALDMEVDINLHHLDSE